MDYSKAGVPMLTVTAGDRSTRNQIAIYTALLVILSSALSFTSVGGWFYAAASTILNGFFIFYTLRVFFSVTILTKYSVRITNKNTQKRNIFTLYFVTIVKMS
jgi:protoheme IX farnesyltransferase